MEALPQNEEKGTALLRVSSPTFSRESAVGETAVEKDDNLQHQKYREGGASDRTDGGASGSAATVASDGATVACGSANDSKGANGLSAEEAQRTKAVGDVTAREQGTSASDHENEEESTRRSASDHVKLNGVGKEDSAGDNFSGNMDGYADVSWGLAESTPGGAIHPSTLGLGDDGRGEFDEFSVRQFSGIEGLANIIWCRVCSSSLSFMLSLVPIKHGHRLFLYFAQKVLNHMGNESQSLVRNVVFRREGSALSNLMVRDTHTVILVGSDSETNVKRD